MWKHVALEVPGVLHASTTDRGDGGARLGPGKSEIELAAVNPLRVFELSLGDLRPRVQAANSTERPRRGRPEERGGAARLPP